jgi:GTPase SAR1 family protein
MESIIKYLTNSPSGNDEKDNIEEIDQLFLPPKETKQEISNNFFFGVPNELFFDQIFPFLTYKDVTVMLNTSKKFKQFFQSQESFEFQKKSIENIFDLFYWKENNEHYDMNINLFVYGDANVGKHSLMHRICFGRFFNQKLTNRFEAGWTLKSSTGLLYSWSEEVLSTESILEANSFTLRKFWVFIQPDSKYEKSNIKNMKNVKFFNHEKKMNYYHNSECLIYLVMFSLDSQTSFQNSKNLVLKLFESDPVHARKRIFFVGNKVDLKVNTPKFQKIIDQFLQTTNVKYFEISTRTGEGISKLFENFDSNFNFD